MMADQAPTSVAECSLSAESDTRIFQLVDRGAGHDPRWWLTLTRRGASAPVTELPLPNARVERTAGTLALSSASGNGGLAVTLRAAPSGSLLDVFVNFELEVNVWRDLSPNVDAMNTHGPQSQVMCRVLSAPEGMP
jgi:hypothetical protein